MLTMHTEELYLADLDGDQALEYPPEPPPDRQATLHEEPAWPEPDAQEASASAIDNAAPLPALEALALDLTLRCGALKLNLGQLRHLAEGVVLEVNGIAPGHATLCHGERILAEGELVDVDGRLGLQITRMAARA
jgi:type III secretion protein Q